MFDERESIVRWLREQGTEQRTLNAAELANAVSAGAHMNFEVRQDYAGTIYRAFAKGHKETLDGISNVAAVCSILTFGMFSFLLEQDRYVLATLSALVSVLLFYGVTMPCGRGIPSWSDLVREHDKNETI